MLDLNADGKQDALYCPEGRSDWAYRLGNETGFGPEVPLSARIDHNGAELNLLCARQGGSSRPVRVDLTGDGVPEILANVDGSFVPPGSPRSVAGLSAVSFAPGADGKVVARAFITGLPGRMYADPGKTVDPIDTQVVPLDANGDGLTDLVTFEYADNTQNILPGCRSQKCALARLWRNRGVLPKANGSVGWMFQDSALLTTLVKNQDGEVEEANVGIPTRYWTDALPTLKSVFALDYDNDGRSDLVLPGMQNSQDFYNPVPFLVHRGFRETTKNHRRGFSRSTTIDPPTFGGGDVPPLTLGHQYVLGDFNGDGAQDIKVYTPRTKKDYAPEVPATEWTGFGGGPTRYLLTDAEDGLGNRSTFAYAPGSWGPYTRETATAPLRTAQRPPHTVVETLTHRGGGLKRTFRQQRFAYRAFTYDSVSHTPLGFRSRDIDDLDSEGTLLSRTTVTYHHRGQTIDGATAYPFAKRAASVKTLTFHAGNDHTSVDGYSVFTERTLEWNLRSSDAAGRFFVELESESTKQTILNASGTSMLAPQQVLVETTYDTDQHGNVTRATQDYQDGHTFTQRAVFALPSEFASRWQIRLPSSTSVEHHKGTQLLAKRQHDYTYYANGLLFLDSNPDPDPEIGGTIVYNRDEAHDWQVTEIRDNAGTERVTQILYDGGNVFPIRTINSADHATDLTVHPALGTIANTIEPGTVQRVFRYDLLGRLQQITGPEGTRTISVAKVTNPDDDFHGLAIDAVVQETVQEPWGARTHTQFNSLGQPVSIARDGFNTSVVRQEMEYDERGNLLKQTRPHGPQLDGVEKYHYDTAYELERIEHANATSEWYASVPAALLRTELRHVIDSATQTVQVVRNARGYLKLDALDKRERVQQHAEELVDIGSTSASWVRTRYGYGAFDAITRIVDPAGNPTEIEVDAEGRVRSRVDPSSGYSEYHYSPRGELVAEVDAEGRSHEYDYDSLGRLVARRSWDGDDATWTYDCRPEDLGSDRCLPIEQGKVLRSSTASGNTVDLRYYASSDPATGALIGYESEVTRRTRAPNDQVISLTQMIRYTKSGFVRSVSYPSSRDFRGDVAFGVSYVYDHEAGGELIRINDAVTGQPLWTAEAQEHGYRVTLERLGNTLGVRTSFEGNTGLVSRLVAGAGAAIPTQSALLQNQVYSYDEAGNLTSENAGDTGPAFATRYAYDSLDRLRATHLADIVQSEYRYDVLGNIVFKKGLGDYQYDEPSERTLDAGGAPTAGLYEHYRPYAARAFGSTEVLHDLSGNEVFRDAPDGTRKLLDYNAANLPRKVELLDEGRMVELDYDADGERVAKHDGAQHTYYLGDVYTRKITTDGMIEHTYLVDLGNRSTYQHVRREGPIPAFESHYIVRDQRGSAVLITDGEGKAVDSNKFGPFGEPTGGGEVGADKPGYTGHLHDPEFGLVNMKGRLYDPVSGRFTTPDPFVFRPWGAGLNRYSYVENNPLKHVDPSGFELIRLPEDTITADPCAYLPNCGRPNDIGRAQQSMAQMERQIGQMDAQMNAAANRTAGAAGSNGKEVLGGSPVRDPATWSDWFGNPPEAVENGTGEIVQFAIIPEDQAIKDVTGLALVYALGVIAKIPAVKDASNAVMARILLRVVPSLGRSGAAKALAAAMVAAGKIATPGSVPHHIVAVTARAAAPARAVLAKFGIDINAAANGVFLPANGATANPAGAAIHSRIHTSEYYQAVNQALSSATTRQQVLDILDDIGNSLLSGGVP